jgi:hypothetical protein
VAVVADLPRNLMCHEIAVFQVDQEVAALDLVVVL